MSEGGDMMEAIPPFEGQGDTNADTMRLSDFDELQSRLQYDEQYEQFRRQRADQDEAFWAGIAVHEDWEEDDEQYVAEEWSSDEQYND